MAAHGQRIRLQIADRVHPALDVGIVALAAWLSLSFCSGVTAQVAGPAAYVGTPTPAPTASPGARQSPSPPPDLSINQEAGRLFWALRDFALRSDDPEVRLAYISRFGAAGGDSGLFSAALRDSDHRVWAEAVSLLMRQQRLNSSFVADLTAHLDSPVVRARLMAAEALGRLAPWVVPDTLPRLATLVRDKEPEVRRTALGALERFETAAAAAAISVLEAPPLDPDDSFWLRSIALARWRIDPGHADPVAWLFLRPSNWANPVAVDRAAAWLALEYYTDDPTRGLAWVVSQGPDQIWPRCLPVIRAWADSSGSTPDPAHVPWGANHAILARAENLTNALVARLDAPEATPEVRVALIEAIGRFHQAARPALPTLHRALAVEDDDLRRLQIAAVILRIDPNDREAVDLLWAAAIGSDSTLGDVAVGLWVEAIRSSPYWTVGSYGENPVRRALGSSDRHMIERAWPLAISLPFIIDPTLAESLLPGVLERLKDHTGRRLCEAVEAATVLMPVLTSYGRVAVVRSLINCLEDRDPRVRKTVLGVLASEVVSPPDFAVTGPAGEAGPLLDRPPPAPPGPAPVRVTPAQLPKALETELVGLVRKYLADGNLALRKAALSSLPPAFLVRDEYRPAYLDALAERLNDESRLVRTMALDLCVEPRFPMPGHMPVPAFSDDAWQRIIRGMKARLRSEDMTARREAVDELRRLSGIPRSHFGLEDPEFLRFLSAGGSSEPRRTEITRELVPALEGADTATRRVVARAILDVEFGLPREAAPLLAAQRAIAETEKEAWFLHGLALEIERVTGDTADARAAWRDALVAPEPERDKSLWDGVALADRGPCYDQGHPDLASHLIDDFTGELGRGTPTAQRGAALALARLARWLDERQAAALLRILLTHPDPVVRRRVSDALARWLKPEAPARIAPAPQAPFNRNTPLWPPPPGSRPHRLLTDPTHDADLAWETIVSRVLAEILDNKRYDKVCFSVVPPGPRIANTHGRSLNPDGASDDAELGLALLIETEPVRPNGDRLPASERPTGRAKFRLQPPQTLGEFWAQMIGKPPGRYRMTLIVFWPPPGELPVGEDLGSTGRLADDMANNPFWWEDVRDPQTVLNSLPDSMKGRHVGRGNVWVVFYDFIRKPKQVGLEQVGSGENALLSLKKAELNGLLEIGRVSPSAGPEDH